MNETPHYAGHRKRLQERFQKSAAQGMHQYEVLELLLTYAIPRKDVKPVAKALMKRFGSISGILDARLEDLHTVQGIGTTSTTLMKLVKEMIGMYFQDRMAKSDFLSSPQAVINFARARISGNSYESFMAVYLNVKNVPVAHEILHEGTLDHAVVYPRRVIESAISHRAASVIFIHNHPSGQCEPSSQDRELTRTLAKATSAVEIRLLDHIIIGKGGYFSFAEKNLPELRS